MRISKQKANKIVQIWYDGFVTDEKGPFGTALNRKDVLHIKYEEQKYSEAVLRFLHNTVVFRWLVPFLKTKKRTWKESYDFNCATEYKKDDKYFVHSESFISTIRRLEPYVEE